MIVNRGLRRTHLSRGKGPGGGLGTEEGKGSESVSGPDIPLVCLSLPGQQNRHAEPQATGRRGKRGLLRGDLASQAGKKDTDSFARSVSLEIGKSDVELDRFESSPGTNDWLVRVIVTRNDLDGSSSDRRLGILDSANDI
jgi:hypothetical protein